MTPSADRWVDRLAWIALFVFVAVPVFAIFFTHFAGRVVWTIVVAGLPLFIVLVGYHRWRRICPLAFFSQIPVKVGKPGTRKASRWLEANYHYVVLAVFTISLWIRLVATNGDGLAIAIFFVALSFAALCIGLVYTGKTWCNHFCPVSFVEKVYTEPHGLRETSNSQCEKCTACKKSCPDISEENGYWKEILSTPKKIAYFAFPGLVFGFYFYYYLQSGTWEYYFGGTWTDQPRVYDTAFLPGYDAKTAGFFFLPSAPRAWASLATLLVCALLSFLFFTLLQKPLERWIRKRNPEADAVRVRHVLFSIASFTAFITFYSFAGAPTLRKIYPAPHFFLIIVVLTATAFAIRRIPRTQHQFAEEAIARKILKRWEWPDIKPANLREAFLIYTARTKESSRGEAKILEVYADAVRQTLQEDFVTREEVQKLASLRDTLQIRKEEHDRIMEDLAVEQRVRITDPSRHISTEKRLQLMTYSKALQDHFTGAMTQDTDPEEALVVKLRSQFLVSKEEHMAVLDQLMGGTRNLAQQLAYTIAAIEKLSGTIRALRTEPSPLHNFLVDLLQRRKSRVIETLLSGLRFAVDPQKDGNLRSALGSDDRKVTESAVAELCAALPSSLCQRVQASYREASAISEGSSHIDFLRARTRGVDPYIRGISLYALSRQASADEEIRAMVHDEHDFPRGTALRLLAESEGASPAMPGTIEKMIILRSVPMFASLAPQGLEELAGSSKLERFEPGRVLCNEGEQGSDVYIIVSGSVEIHRRIDGKSQRISTTSKDGLIGELAVLDPAPRSASVLAGSGGAEILTLEGLAFRECLNADPLIAAQVLSTLAGRLRLAQSG